MYYLSMSSDEILNVLIEQNSELPDVLARVRKRVPEKKREIALFQAAALYTVVKPYNAMGVQILEIGTFIGYSAAIMAEAAPLAQITTLNPRTDEVYEARQNLRHYSNVEVIEAISWDYLKSYHGPYLDVIFIDGDHKHIYRDMPWWDWLNPGGNATFHDYSPAESSRPCPPVYDCLNAWVDEHNHPFDVLVMDNELVGLAGFYKTDVSAEHVEP